MPLFFLAQSKSPDYGARIYINASVAKPDQHVRIPPPSPTPPSPKVKITTFLKTQYLPMRVHISRANFSAITCQTNNTKGELLLIGLFIQIISLPFPLPLPPPPTFSSSHPRPLFPPPPGAEYHIHN